MKPSIFSPKSIAAVLTLVAIAVVYISVLSELSRHFDLRTSGNSLVNAAEKFRLTAIYGALLLLHCAVLVVCICLSKKKRADPYVPHWMFLAFIFAGLSLTKATYIHGFALEFLRSIDLWIGLPVTIPAIATVVVAVLAVPYWKFLKALERQLRKMLFAGGFIFFGGAILMEALTEFFWYSKGRGTSYYIASSAIEDLLEMIGCIILIYALSEYWRDERDGEKLEDEST